MPVSTADLIKAGAGALAESVILGGNEGKKGVGPATAAIRKRYAVDFPGLTYDEARNVVKRVMRWVERAEEIRSGPSSAVPIKRLPINPALENETMFAAQYKVVVQFTSQAGRKNYRTVTLVNSNKALSLDEVKEIAEQQVREDRGYNARTGKSTRPAVELKNYNVSDFSLISATRRG